MTQYAKWLEAEWAKTGQSRERFSKILGIHSSTIRGIVYEGAMPRKKTRLILASFYGAAVERKMYEASFEAGRENAVCLVSEGRCHKNVCCRCCPDREKCEDVCLNNPDLCRCIDDISAE